MARTTKVTIDNATVAQDQKTTTVAKKYDPNDPIPCRSVTHGELLLEGKKSKLLYTWANAGDITDVEYQDLQALQSMKSRFLTDPLFVIEDQELVKRWKSVLGSIYEKIDTENVESIFNLSPANIKKRLQNAPIGLRNSVMSMASEKILNGELDSISKIKAIDEVLGTELLSIIV